MSPTSNLRAYLPKILGGTAPDEQQVDTPAPPTNEPPKKQFRLDNDSSDTLTLSDGRKLGYAQYGAPTGKPVFFMPGLPGSRLDAAGFDDVGKESGARIISVDRPGIGWSTPQPDRKVLDHPKDVEQLADHLKLDRYSVMGISGGGPYALACAKALPADKLKCVSIIVGMGPPDIGMAGADIAHKMGFPHGLRIAPFWLVRKFWQIEGSGRLDLTEEQRHQMMLQTPVPNEKDKAFMSSPWTRLNVRSTREAFSQGYEGVWLDGKLICTPFGFRVEDIRKDLPVSLWYGKLDTFVPPNQGVQIAARLGANANLNLVDETHASIVANSSIVREIFDDLVKKT